MARYIDADAMIERLKKQYCEGCNNYNEIKCRSCETDDTIGFLEDAPTADVVEVKHGHWITQEEAEALDRYDLAFCCSACCELNWDCTESESFNFCPNCGAKMDGERRETNAE